MQLKWLVVVVVILATSALVLSFTGYPKTIEKTIELTISAQSKDVQLHIDSASFSTNEHLLHRSRTFNVEFDSRVEASADSRLENINFYINCFNARGQLIGCTDGTIVSQESMLDFSREWSLITKTPLDVTLIEQSQSYNYKPMFFGIIFEVRKIVFIYTDTPYSRTDLRSTTTSDLALPVDVPW